MGPGTMTFDLDDRRQRVLAALACAMRRSEAERGKLLGVKGVALAAATEANRTVMSAPTKPAIERHSGVLYDALDRGSLAPAHRRRFDRSVVIISGLWGLVTPADPVPDYKLKMGAKLGRLGVLSTWWRDELTTRLSVVSHRNKLLKGALLRFLVAIPMLGPGELAAWEHPMGFRYDRSRDEQHGGLTRLSFVQSWGSRSVPRMRDAGQGQREHEPHGADRERRDERGPRRRPDAFGHRVAAPSRRVVQHRARGRQELEQAGRDHRDDAGPRERTGDEPLGMATAQEVRQQQRCEREPQPPDDERRDEHGVGMLRRREPHRSQRRVSQQEADPRGRQHEHADGGPGAVGRPRCSDRTHRKGSCRGKRRFEREKPGPREPECQERFAVGEWTEPSRHALTIDPGGDGKRGRPCGSLPPAAGTRRV